jgi:GT2 family glycosyltransferase
MYYDLIVSIVVYKPKLSQLQQTLDSLSQSPVNIKILLADNSPSALKTSDFQCTKPLDYIFNGENLGYGRAHNQSFFNCTDASPYILVLNPDVFFDPPLLSNILAIMQADPKLGLSIPKICHPQGNVQIINRRIPRPIDYVISFLSGKLKSEMFKTKKYQLYQMKDLNTDLPFVCPTISGCFMFMQTKAFVEAAGFDERFFLYMEDTDLSRRISEKYKTVVLANLTAYHHWSRGAYRSTRLFFLFVRSMVLYFNKWGWFYDPVRTHLNNKVTYYPLELKKSQTPIENSVLNPAQV